ncbi:MAG: tetratricopeptide repeat protein [Planctomycetes bacterium]|nr:tetratricopeptide repeat protein [Planctomycetota bacterium]
MPVLSGGDTLYRVGQYEKAAEEYLRLAPSLKGVTYEEAVLKAGLSYLSIAREESKKPEEDRDADALKKALDSAEKYLPEVSEGEFRAPAVMGLAHAAIERGDTSRAAALIHSAVAKNPSAPSAWELRAWPLAAAQELNKCSRFTDALLLYEATAELPGQDDYTAASVLCDAAKVCLYRLGQVEHGMELLERIERDYAACRWHAADARVRRGSTYSMIGQQDKALLILESVKEKYPDVPGLIRSAAQQQAIILNDMNRFDDALALLDSIEKDYPGNQYCCADARFYKGRVLRVMRRLDEAFRAYKSIEEEYPGARARCAEARVWQGRILMSAGEYEKALETLRSVEKDYPDQGFGCVQARISQGMAMRAAGRFQEALETLESAEKDYSDQESLSQSRVQQGLTLLSMGRLQDAVKILASTKTEYPGQRADAGTGLLCAGAYCDDASMSRKYLEAAAEYRERLGVSAPAEYLLGRITERELEEKWFVKYRTADIEYWKGEKALRNGDKEEAIVHFRKAVELNIPGETRPLFEAQLRLKQLHE